MADLVLDPALERARYEARLPLLRRQAALRAGLAPGIFLQPETEASVADQVRETLWAEGKTPETCDPAELDEVRASFAALSPRREPAGWSLAATLMIGMAEAAREARLRGLEGFPEQLRLELQDGSRLEPAVDRGLALEGGRLPSVVALRWSLPGGAEPLAFISEHPALAGRWAAPALEGWIAR
ncbi:MAG TPA: DUF3501 family protein [Holophagaceae bacterium]|nr:DUF3501 family protein [Holophagaceae bacterium]